MAVPTISDVGRTNVSWISDPELLTNQRKRLLFSEFSTIGTVLLCKI